MALETIPPWLQTPNFLGAMEGGARLGLEQRREDLLQSQTADRLKLAYEQLGAKERIASQAVHARQLQAQAALALRQNFLDLAVRNATERERHNRALETGRSPASELQKFDVADTKKRLGKVSQDLRDDPIWSSVGTTGRGQPYSPDLPAIAAFNLKQKTAELLRDKLRGMGKGARGSSKPVTHRYDPTAGLIPVGSTDSDSSSAASDLLGSDEEEED